MKASMPLFLHTPLTPGLGSKVLFCFLFLNVVMLHFKFKCKKCKFTHTLDLWGWVETRSDIGILQMLVYFFLIKLSSKTYVTGVCNDLNDTEGELRV